MKGSELADLLIKVTPELFRFGRDLLRLHGSADTAVRELKGRREEIARRRARNDAALAEKYTKG